MRTEWTRRFFVAAALAPLVAFAAVAPGATAGAEGANEAPSADKVGTAVANYLRVRPGIATGGRLAEGAVGQLKALGFRTIVDLRGPGEGVESEGLAAEAAGLRHVNIPVTVGAPSDAEVAEFARIIEDAANEPILVHCASGNRVGAMWTLYLAGKGIPVARAVEEGRAIGMRGEREAAVLSRLQQPSTGQ